MIEVSEFVGFVSLDYLLTLFIIFMIFLMGIIIWDAYFAMKDAREIKNGVVGLLSGIKSEVAPQIVTFEQTDVVEVTIKLKNQVDNAEISVREHGTPNSSTYGFFEISSRNIENQDISEIGIIFRVERSWIEKYGIDEGSIALKDCGNGWSSLPTDEIGRDDFYIYYFSKSKGFSIFAVSGERVARERKTLSYF